MWRFTRCTEQYHGPSRKNERAVSSVSRLAEIMPLPVRPPSEGPKDSDHILLTSNIEKIHNEVVYLTRCASVKLVLKPGVRNEAASCHAAISPTSNNASVSTHACINHAQT